MYIIFSVYKLMKDSHWPRSKKKEYHAGVTDSKVYLLHSRSVIHNKLHELNKFHSAMAHLISTCKVYQNKGHA